MKLRTTRDASFWIACSCVLAWGPVLSSLADDDKPTNVKTQQNTIFSGPQIGEDIKPFEVLRVKGEDAKEVEILKETADGTTLLCFVHRLSNDDRILFGLGIVDFYARRHQNLDSHIVLLTDERERMKNLLRAWTKGDLSTKSQLSLSVDGIEGPGFYGLNRNVAMTVLVAKGDRVVDNLVFNAPNANDLAAIMAAVSKALDQPKPQLAKVQQELRAERQRRQDKLIKSSPVFKLAPDEELGRIMFGMVNARGNLAKNAERRSKMLRDWAGDSEDRMASLQKYWKAILAGGFQLNRYSREAVEQLVED